MKLQIVPSDAARDLEKLGFDWECNLGYCFLYDDVLKLIPKGLLANWSAPEQSLVCKWFRDKYNLSIEPGIFKGGYKSCVVTITADKYCWTLTMYFPIDKENKSEKQLAAIKNDFAEHQTYHGSLLQAITAYCDAALLPVQDDVKMLLERLESLTEEIKAMDLSKYKRYV